MKALFVKFVRGTDGQDLIEYALLAAGISIAAATVIYSVGSTLNGKFDSSSKAHGVIKDKIVFRKNDPNHRGTCKGQSKFNVHLK